MNQQTITYKVYKQVTVTQEVEQTLTMSQGFKVLLKETLFPFDVRLRNKVAAIKAVRAEYCIGLKEAKDIVDALTEDSFHSTETPAWYP
jgi:ribosomal protein L7/L12